MGRLWNNGRFALGVCNDKLWHLGHSWQYDLYTETSICDASWHFVAATHNGATLTLFVDGVVVASAERSFNTAASNVHIAFNGGGDRDLNYL